MYQNQSTLDQIFNNMVTTKCAIIIIGFCIQLIREFQVKVVLFQ